MNSRTWFPLLAGCALAFAGATAASADCAEELAEVMGGVKDGTLAPMQTEPAAKAETGQAVTTETAGQPGTEAGVAEGSGAPMQTGDAATGAAVSGQAAQAQQETGGDARAEALAKAEAALTAGDEEGCMTAVEEARNL